MHTPTCTFCGGRIETPMGPSYDVLGRAAHWRCSMAPYFRGEWLDRLLPPPQPALLPVTPRDGRASPARPRP